MIMRKINKKVFEESPVRTFVKAISFRLFVLCADSTIIYFLTHRLDITFGVMIFSNLSSTLIYIIHERVWNTVHWGKMGSVR